MEVKNKSAVSQAPPQLLCAQAAQAKTVASSRLFFSLFSRSQSGELGYFWLIAI
jgi:hypothetical protein